MAKRNLLTTIAVLITILFSIVSFVAVRNGRTSSNVVGGEMLLIFLPVIAYIICKNISLSLDVFCTREEDVVDDYSTQIVSEPKKISEKPSRVTVFWSTESSEEDS